MDEARATDGVADALRRISEAWLSGRVNDLAPLVHPEIVMALPGFSGRVRGREPLLAGFRDFCENARTHEYREHDQQIDVTDGIAVATFAYEMIYERGGQRYRVTGRDLWVFQKEAGEWIAVWRTMLDLDEQPA